MRRKPGIYYKYRSEEEQGCWGAAGITSGGGWYVCMARVLPRKTYGWIVCRNVAHMGCWAVQICCKDGSMRYAANTYDGGVLQEITEDGDLPENVACSF